MALREESDMILNSDIDEKRIYEIGALYEASFPENERMPFERILKKRSEGVMRLLSIEDQDRAFLGFANITLCFDALVLNYFAIVPTEQGKGYGTQTLERLKELYPKRSIVIDIEDDGIKAENSAQRIRRRQFYERLGFRAMPYRVTIVGVESLIMSSGREYSFEEYKAIFSQAFSSWAAERVILNE